ncbi:MAG: hypothetical protein JJU25_02870 [Halomonas sp.]|nr:FimV/HubP family polar landmark protein [Halomonas sp.]MCC5881565.1 hypothetical protein [Halomonas sp.]
MRRKLTLAVMLSLLAASPPALALGVGEVEVRSPLNAPLRAVIPLTDTAAMDPELLRVSVADPREFDSAGLLRTAIAASVRAEVEVRQGQWVVTLASERAVREPWMDLLLRFDWPGGRQLREVTLLLDPPDYDRMPVLISGSQRQSPAANGSADTSPEPTAERASRPSMGSRNQAQAVSSAWVGSGDTLWSVATRLRPDDGITLNQMMVALVEANPAIFPSGNINAMRAGHSLNVPSREAITTRSDAEADRVVQAMNQAWASRGSGAPVRVALGPSLPAGESVREAAVASVEPPDTNEPASQPQAAVATTPAEEAADAPPRLTLLSDEELAVEVARAAAVSNAPERAAAGARPAALDAEVLATLGGSELALERNEPRLALLEQRWQESRAALTEVQAERDLLQQELGGLQQQVEAMREQLAALLAEGGRATGAGMAGAVAQPEIESDQDEASWWGAAYPAAVDRNLLLGAAGLAALLGLWLWVRRRQRRDAVAIGNTPTPGMVHGMPPSGAPAPSSATATMLPPLVPGLTVGEAEEPPQDGPRPSMPHAEAISEADIFMAYGRYDQAKELLEAGLDRDPGRHEQRLKLLDIHVQQGSWGAAEEEMQILAETGDSALMAEAARLMARRPAESDIAAEPMTPGQEESDHAAETMPSAEAEQEQQRPGTEADDVTAAPDFAAEPREAHEAAPIEWDVIDYQPPRLDPEPALREETPMQPSVDFPRTNPDGSEPLDSEDKDDSQWEVEEVAFPPLDHDNGPVQNESAQWDELADARRLLEQGEVERARPLVQGLLDGADEPRLREEARALITHYRL